MRNAPSFKAELPTDRVAILEQLAKLEEERHRLQDTMAVVASIMNELQNQCQVVDKHIALHKAELSPVSALPIEILQEIFLHCHPPAEVDLHRWQLERVSRKWQQAALGCAELWSYIFVDKEFLKSVSNPVETIDIWAQRSCEGPLDVDFSQCWSPPVGPFSLLSPLFRHCHRWRHVKLHIGVPSIVRALESLQGSFRMLQSLELSLSLLDSSFTSIDAFSTAPNLSRLALIYDLRVLVNTPSHALSSLTLYNSDLLLDLTLPNLKHLHVNDEYRRPARPTPFSTIVSFVQRSHCNLTSLSVCLSAVVWQDAEEAFRLLPNLEWLCFENPSNDEGFQDIVHGLHPDKDRPLLPKLQRLDLDLRTFLNDAIVFPLLDVVQKRRMGSEKVAKLRRFSWWGIPTPGVYQRLNPLRDDGLVISLRHDESDEEACLTFGNFWGAREDEEEGDDEESDDEDGEGDEEEWEQSDGSEDSE
ncbi:hypothetical protein AX16_002812 [Volvariella volvacea WC 439]|nr:hypothetical protein AX16_002812 [Volvariella volvacea WC 439]